MSCFLKSTVIESQRYDGSKTVFFSFSSQSFFIMYSKQSLPLDKSTVFFGIVLVFFLKIRLNGILKSLPISLSEFIFIIYSSISEPFVEQFFIQLYLRKNIAYLFCCFVALIRVLHSFDFFFERTT